MDPMLTQANRVTTFQDSTGITLCRMTGDLDAFTAGELREVAAGLRGAARVVFDLSDVPFIDSTGLGALIGGIRRLREAGGAVVVCSTRAPVVRLLRTVGLDRVVAVTRDRDEARRHLESLAVA